MRAVLRIELVSGTGRDVGLKTIEPATRLSGGAMGNSSLVGVQAGRLNEFLKLSVGDNRRGLPLLYRDHKGFTFRSQPEHQDSGWRVK